jgi:hypothetical protein
MSRTLGIITFHHAQNYGAVLQAYALQKSIFNLGHKCYIIDYRSSLIGNAEKLFCFDFTRNGIRQILRTLVNLSDNLRSRKRFSKFRESKLNLTSKRYRSIDELADSRAIFYSYICGSDQVWNPNLLDSYSYFPYFCSFVKDERKISYAPSFGSIEKLPSYQDEVSSLLSRFDFLSAREEAGCHLINSCSGRRAIHALDPTLLLEKSDLDIIAAMPQCPRRYILLYPMARPTELCKIAQSMRNRFKLPLIAILPIYHSPTAFRFADKIIYDAGPAEFLGWIKAADYICSNSYHGISLSIAFHKNFVATADSGSNIRSQSLLRRLGLQTRQVLDATGLQNDYIFYNNINYDHVGVSLRSARDESLEYLRAAMR